MPFLLNHKAEIDNRIFCERRKRPAGIVFVDSSLSRKKRLQCHKKFIAIVCLVGMGQPMDISVKDLEEAIAIRRQIDSLEQRLASIIGKRSGGTGRITTPRSRRGVPPATRAKLAAAARARWARMRRLRNSNGSSKRRNGASPAGRRKTRN